MTLIFASLGTLSLLAFTICMVAVNRSSVHKGEE